MCVFIIEKNPLWLFSVIQIHFFHLFRHVGYVRANLISLGRTQNDWGIDSNRTDKLRWVCVWGTNSSSKSLCLLFLSWTKKNTLTHSLSFSFSFSFSLTLTHTHSHSHTHWHTHTLKTHSHKDTLPHKDTHTHSHKDTHTDKTCFVDKIATSNMKWSK